MFTFKMFGIFENEGLFTFVLVATSPKNTNFRNEMFRQIDDQSLFTVWRWWQLSKPLIVEKTMIV